MTKKCISPTLVRLNIWSINIMIFKVIGDVFVVQPDFIFNATTSSNETLTTSSNKTQTTSHGDPSYFIGVGLSLYTALAISLANILQVIVSGLPNKGENNSSNHIMLASGMQIGILVGSTLLEGPEIVIKLKKNQNYL